MKRLSKGLGAVALASVCWTGVDAGSPRQETTTKPAARPVVKAPVATPGAHAATVKQYCVTCHNDRAKTAGLSLEAWTSPRPPTPDVWEKVVRKVRVGMMPPQGAPQPDRRRATALVALADDGARSRTRPRSPIPGRPLLHRLNRAEYANAIRDLLALEVDAAALLPPDDSGVRLRQHRRRARRVAGAARALPRRRPARSARWPSAIPSIGAGQRDLPRPPGRVAGPAHRRAAARHRRRHAGAARRSRSTASTSSRPSCSGPTSGAMRGLEYPHQLEITVDGERVHLATVRRRRRTSRPRSTNPTLAGDDVEARLQVRVPLTAGPHDDRRRVPREARRRRTAGGCSRSCAARTTRSTRPATRTSTRSRSPGRSTPTGPGDTPSRRRIFIVPARRRPPRKSRARAASSRRWRAARIAARRPPDDLAAPDGVLRDGPAASGTFERGIQLALQRMLASPKFALPRSSAIRRARRPARSIASATSSWRRGSRSSCGAAFPDDELLRVAAAGPAAARRRCCGSRCAACWPTRRREALVDQLRRPVAVPAQPARTWCRTRPSSPTSTTTCGRRSSARPSCSSRASCARTATCSI